MRVLKNLSEAEALVGKELGFSKWQRISQLQIWGFGLFTGDRQWIHMRPLKAKLGSPFKTTIAHGFLVLSLLPKMLEKTYRISSAKMGVNYGVDRVRFTSATPSGGMVRGRVSLLEFEVKSGGAKYKLGITVELKGQDKPVCVAETLAIGYE